MRINFIIELKWNLQQTTTTIDISTISSSEKFAQFSSNVNLEHLWRFEVETLEFLNFSLLLHRLSRVEG